jgi:hypothetical protein
MFEKNPGMTARQVIASVEKEHHLSLRRARARLGEGRIAAAKRNPVHKQKRSRIDSRLAVRLRIRAIGVQQP